jgi:hypothetical protein
MAVSLSEYMKTLSDEEAKKVKSRFDQLTREKKTRC